MKNTETEVRAFNFDVEPNEEGLKISGLAIPFNSQSQILGDFQEVIETRAVKETAIMDTFLLFNHDFNNILASKNANSLILEIREDGLYFSANIINNNKGNDTYALIKRGDLRQMSFSMNGINDTWDFTKEIPLRKINTIGLIQEISIVPNPAYTETKVSTRSINFKNECIECRAENIKHKQLKSEFDSIIESVKK